MLLWIVPYPFSSWSRQVNGNPEFSQEMATFAGDVPSHLGRSLCMECFGEQSKLSNGFN